MLRQLIIIMTLMATMPAIKCTAQSKQPVSYKAKVTEVLPHDVNAYTQALFFHEGRLYESSGQYGQSYFREVDLARGTTVRSFNLAAKYFAEGVQFHPELKSTPENPHPLFVSLVEAALKRKLS